MNTFATLIATDVLASHLQAGWAIVDCRFDLKDDSWGRTQYLTAHIPGAVYASLNDDLAARRTGTNGRHPLPSVESLAGTFGRLGIDNRTQVIVYDQDSGLFASRFWWSLRYLGHTSAALLDGGWAKWVREGRPTSEGEEVRRAAVFAPRARRELVVGLGEVERRIGDERTLLVDARGPDRFEGQSETIDKVAGHIPGAQNHFYKWNLAEDGTMLPPDTLKENFSRLLDGRAPEQAVMYCGSGVSACHNLLAMEHAGLTGTPLFPGSWSEWSSDPARKIETGPARKSRR